MATSDKEQQVVSWRKEVLIKAGWESAAASDIAGRFNIDLRVAEAAIKCGDPKKALYLLSLSDEE